MQNEVKQQETHKAHLPFLMFLCIAPTMEGFFVSSGVLRTVIRSVLSRGLSDRFGRSRNLDLAAILLWISARKRSRADEHTHAESFKAGISIRTAF